MNQLFKIMQVSAGQETKSFYQYSGNAFQAIKECFGKVATWQGYNETYHSEVYQMDDKLLLVTTDKNQIVH